jgi:hypothetical protein
LTASAGRALRVALVHHCAEPAVDPHQLARALLNIGHDPKLLTATPAPARVADGLLRRRQIDTPLAHLPFSVRGLLAGGYDIAHTFSAPDALAALTWRRLSGRPVVLSCLAAPRRAPLADRRLRLRMLNRALESCDAVVVPSDAVRDAADRWLAVPATVIALDDARGHEELYCRLIVARA